jgi:MFS family permease
MAIVISLTAYISKRTPKNIRGMIYAVIGSMSAIGSVIYLQVYNALFIASGWPWLSFAVMVLIDICMLCFLLAMIIGGKFGSPVAGTMDEDGRPISDAIAIVYTDIPKQDAIKEVQEDLEKSMDNSKKKTTFAGRVDQLLESLKFTGGGMVEYAAVDESSGEDNEESFAVSAPATTQQFALNPENEQHKGLAYDVTPPG